MFKKLMLGTLLYIGNVFAGTVSCTAVGDHPHAKTKVVEIGYSSQCSFVLSESPQIVHSLHGEYEVCRFRVLATQTKPDERFILGFHQSFHPGAGNAEIHTMPTVDNGVRLAVLDIDKIAFLGGDYFIAPHFAKEARYGYVETLESSSAQPWTEREFLVIVTAQVGALGANETASGFFTVRWVSGS